MSIQFTPMKPVGHKPMKLTELAALTLSPLVKRIRIAAINRKLAASNRNIALMTARIKNDTKGKRLYPEHAATFEKQIAHWYAEINDEHTKQANLNIDLFRLENE